MKIAHRMRLLPQPAIAGVTKKRGPSRVIGTDSLQAFLNEPLNSPGYLVGLDTLTPVQPGAHEIVFIGLEIFVDHGSLFESV